MNLFEYEFNQSIEKTAPLAHRMRPERLSEFFGQEHIVGKNTLLPRAILADKLTSMVLSGPPGTGKTTLAQIIAATTKSSFVQLNATTAGVKDIKETAEEAKLTLATRGKRTILFLDEIHRFNKSQQDALLPYVENGTLTLIGATTENPYFEVNKAIISRSTVFLLKPLNKEDIVKILKRAVEDKEKGVGEFNPEVTDEALDFWADVANGDARAALNALELAVLTTKPDSQGVVQINLTVAEECIQKRAIGYDKKGDNHYDTISAFIKSMRGSDPQAAVYYLARMLFAGEDPKFIARRIVICAAEDVGNADPQALVVAQAAAAATDFIGLPECRIILSQAAIYVASAPKSNASYLAIDLATEDVQKFEATVPAHLRDTHSTTKRGEATPSYVYPHQFAGSFCNQQYLPDVLKGKIYYTPTENGKERLIKERLERLWQ